MKIENISYNTLQIKNDKISLTQSIIDEAKNLTTDTQKAIIYDDKVLTLSMDTIQDLHQHFQGSIQKYEDIFIATDKAKSYLHSISNFVLDDLNVQKADKNKDGVLTMAEGLDAKSILLHDRIVKPKDILSPDDIAYFKKDNSVLNTVDEIIEENINFDSDKDGKVSVAEVEAHLKKDSDGPDSILDALYKVLGEIENRIKNLQSKTNSSDTSSSEAASLNGQKGAILGQITKLLELGMS